MCDHIENRSIAYWVNAPVNSTGIAGTVNFSNKDNFWGNLDMFFENGSTADAAKFRVHVVNNGGSSEHWLAKDGIPGIFGNWVHFAVSYDGTSRVSKKSLKEMPGLDTTNLHLVNCNGLVRTWEYIDPKKNYN